MKKDTTLQLKKLTEMFIQATSLLKQGSKAFYKLLIP
jgi:hypothetical protein